MEKISDYKVVVGKDSEDITTKVKDLMSEGWVPYGPAFSLTGSSIYASPTDNRKYSEIAQTLIKY